MDFYILKAKKKSRNFPQVEEINSGLTKIDCKNEDNFAWHPSGTIKVTLSKKGKSWPDILEDIHFEKFTILSEKAIEIFSKNNILSKEDLFSVIIEGKDPIKLDSTKQPKYFVLDYRKIISAEIDYKSVKLNKNKFCLNCGNIMDEDYHDKLFDLIIENKPIDNLKINLSTWKKKDIFSVLGSQILCTQKVIDLVKKHQLKNFVFEKY